MSDVTPSAHQLFARKRRQNHEGIRVVVTGQVGLDKRPFLESVVKLAGDGGHDVALFNVGERMYAEAPDISSGRILDLSRRRLTTLRRSVFKDILQAAATGQNIIVNTHATFRWKHGLFLAYDHTQMVELDADLYVTLVDNVDAVHERLQRDHDVKHTLKDILVWREEEIVVTEAMAEAVAGYGHAYVMSQSNPAVAAQSLFRLMFEPGRKRVYPSYPMTHVLDQSEILAEIGRFRDAIAEHFITFDPADMDEKQLLSEAGEATKRGEDSVTLRVHGRDITLGVTEITQVARDIDGQIYARDFKLIDQSDMIVSYIPALPTGKPALSSGVERELQHAFEGTKEVYVVWRPDCEPSPFVTETATAIFRSVDDLLAHCQQHGCVGDVQLPLTGQ
ncbi:MAG: AAA family ATPase [Phycisphaerales bacterium]|nr:MAG: AAA family ATPase [Phycisphaerales bacterium]